MLAFRNILKNQQWPSRVSQDVRRLAPDGLRGIAGCSVRGKHDEITLLSLGHLTKALTLIRVANDPRADSGSVMCSL
jgi:hypothetical protein